VNDDELSTVVVPSGVRSGLSAGRDRQVKVQVPCRHLRRCRSAEGVTADLQVATGDTSRRGDLKTGRVARRGHEGDAAALLPDVSIGRVRRRSINRRVSVVSPIWLIVLGVTVSVKVRCRVTNPSDVYRDSVGADLERRP